MTLDSHLTTLENVGLVRVATTLPELAYLFRHGLIQDAAYNSLLRADRRTLHLTVGETLEQTYAAQLDELAPVLARHFAAAGDETRALTYFTRAGDEAMRVYANAEAIMHYTHALEIVKRIDVGAGQGQALPLQHLYLNRGRALELSGRYDEALANYEALEALARARVDRAMELAALMSHAILLATPNPKYDPPRGRVLCEQCLALARELGDRAAEARVWWALVVLKVYSGGDWREAMMCGEQSIAIARELNLREQLAFTLTDTYFAYWSLGELTRAQEALAEARELWRALGNLPMLADCLVRATHTSFCQGDYGQAIRWGEESYRVSLQSGNLYGQASYAFLTVYPYLERGEWAQAVDMMTAAIRFADQVGVSHVITGTRATLAQLYGWMGAPTEGLALAQEARTRADALLPMFRPWVLAVLAWLQWRSGDLAAVAPMLTELETGYQQLKRQNAIVAHAWSATALALGELMLAQRDAARAIALMDDMLATLRQYHVRPFVADALYLKAKALLMQNRKDEAYALLREARADAESLNARRILWQILMTLHDLEAQRGNGAAAQALRQQARELVRYMADHCPLTLRASFLQTPEVKAVTDAS
jgi:tetratricopeptide (TPR) repeat protein